MAHEAVRPAAYRRHPRKHDDARVPARAQSNDGPVAKRLRAESAAERYPSERPRKRTLEHDRLGRGRDQEERVERPHQRVMAPPVLDRAHRERAACIARCDHKMEHPLQRERRKNREICAERNHHRSKASSAQNPGPIASISPYSPGRAARASSKSRNTNSTEAEDRLPVAASSRHERSSAPGGSSSAVAIASSTRLPPVCAIQWLIAERASPCSASIASTSPPRCSR